MLKMKSTRKTFQANSTRGGIIVRSDDNVIKQQNLVGVLAQTDQHIKVEICIFHSLFLFVHLLVVQPEIFNGPLQDYIINKPLASVFFIFLSSLVSLSLSLSLTYRQAQIHKKYTKNSDNDSENNFFFVCKLTRSGFSPGVERLSSNQKIRGLSPCSYREQKCPWTPNGPSILTSLHSQ